MPIGVRRSRWRSRFADGGSVCLRIPIDDDDPFPAFGGGQRMSETKNATADDGEVEAGLDQLSR